LVAYHTTEILTDVIQPGVKNKTNLILFKTHVHLLIYMLPTFFVFSYLKHPDAFYCLPQKYLTCS